MFLWINVFVLIMTSLMTYKTSGHVRLSFPPTRTFALDFLDNGRTIGPCGFPPYYGAKRTTVIEGTKITVTWHLAYAHRGGAQIQIIKENPFEILASLTKEKFIYQNDSTNQHAELVLPIGLTCNNCTLRLLRQASEWSDSYQFWSCADLIILPHDDAQTSKCAIESEVNEHGGQEGTEPDSSSEPVAKRQASEPNAAPEPDGDSNSAEKTPASSGKACFPKTALVFTECYAGKCLSGGTCNENDGSCSCLKLFSGDRCHIHDLCWSDSDCNNGKCIDTRSTTQPRLMCYCQQGWHGEYCDKESAVTVKDDYESDSSYKHQKVKPGILTVYWKMIGNEEIEIAVRALTQSWVGFGWRPRNLNTSCKNFPTLTSRIEVDDTFIAFADSQSGKSGSKSPSTDPEAAIEAELESNIEKMCEKKSDHEEGSSDEDDSQEEPAPAKRQIISWEVQEPEAVPEPEPLAQEEPSPDDGEGGHENNEEKESEEEEPQTIYEPPPETPIFTRAGGALSHPMDCSDIVIGSVKGDLHRVQDMYTRDRSTPRPDTYYNDTDDITGSAGSQIDGYTTIVFRKKKHAKTSSDHSIVNSLMNVIWAIGQGVDNYGHRPYSGLESCTASDQRFYRHDEIKYHGTSSEQRGASTINFYADTSHSTECSSEKGEHKEPNNCVYSDSGFDCSYFASWTLDETDDSIKFVLKSKQAQNRWIGIGISENKQMIQTDVILAWIGADGNPVAKDRWISAYAPPPDDAVNDVTAISGRYDNGVMTIEFKRQRNTNDDEDLPFTDASCQYLIYPSGALNSAGGDISKHANTPVVSLEKICIRSCSISDSATAVFNSSLTVTSIKYVDQFKDPTSSEFQHLKALMEKELTINYNRLKVANVLEVSVVVNGFRPGSLIVDYTVTATYIPTEGTTAESLQERLTEALKEAVADNGGKLFGSEAISVQLNKDGEEGFPDWMIAIISVVGMAGIVFLFGFLTLSMQRKSSGKEEPDEAAHTTELQAAPHVLKTESEAIKSHSEK